MCKEENKKIKEQKDQKEKTSKEILEEYLKKHEWLWEDNSPLDEYRQKTK